MAISKARVHVVSRAHYGVSPQAFEKWSGFEPNMRAAAKAAPTEIQLYGLILPHEEVTFLRDCFGDETAMSGKMFREAMEKIEGPVTIRINSDGGDVFEASTMLQAIRERQKGDHPVNCVIDGIAASAASAVAAVCTEIEIAEMGFVMIHEASGGMYGRASDLETGAKMLGDMNTSVADVYAKRTGMERDEILALMDAETYMNAEEAVEKGFADRVAEAPEVDDVDEGEKVSAAMARRNGRLAGIMRLHTVGQAASLN